MSYRIRVRRRFLPLWRTYYVVAHKAEYFDIGSRLILVFADGSKRLVPAVHKRHVIVYPTPKDIDPLDQDADF